MEKIKLRNGSVYNLIVGGLNVSDESVSYSFFDDGIKTFEQIESDFSDSENTYNIYVTDSEEQIIMSIIGKTKYLGMEKIVDYVISSESVNIGTEDLPKYETIENKGTVYIVHMKKPDIEDRVQSLEEENINIMLALTEIYEGGI